MEDMEFRLNYHLGTGEGGRDARYNVCQVLMDHHVPHAIWFEDALDYYGVPTAVFDLYILVMYIDMAVKILAKAGWRFDMQIPHHVGNAQVDLVDFPQQRLISPDGETRTVLLPAADWKFPLASDTRLEFVPLKVMPSLKVPFPPLASFLDALIESWLECPSNYEMLSLVLACQISYLYAHVPALKEKSFAEQLRLEHRQFHYDVLAGMETGTIPFRKHQLAIRDALLQGQYGLRECSASRDNKDLFDPFGGISFESSGEEEHDGESHESHID
ncbi:similar to An03g02240 [Aspergillus niger]|uniref:Similar to An03g02240 n=1 Tax=Aspergillus niger TaxID=5061 RepID=A0A117E2N7_ASPNG|nr:similar to An03g02240 [Aspergillus niger]